MQCFTNIIVRRFLSAHIAGFLIMFCRHLYCSWCI